jgi:hypothetical protein
MRTRFVWQSLLASAVLLGGRLDGVQASLITSYQFNGNGNWSIDGVGGNQPIGGIGAFVPLGSTVEKAFLYSTTWNNNNTFIPSVNFDGTTISGAAWTSLGLNPGSPFGLKAFRADVTSQVATEIGSGAASPFNFSVSNENPTASIDGEALVIVYSNPAEAVRTIALLDGFSNTTGDSTTFNFASPVAKGAGFEAIMSLGIGFSSQGFTQASNVRVNGTLITSSAGGQDDGFNGNGGLITIGGIGDDFTMNPSNPSQGPNGNTRLDDEAYNVAPFISNGDTSLNINTLNPSNDDNIFFLGLNVTAQGNVGPVNPVPEPASLISLGLSALGLAGYTWRRRRRNPLAA